MLRWLAVAGMLGGVGAAATAAPVRMTADDIKRVMQPGAILAVDTPLRISIPVKVAPNGLVSGEAGALGLTLGAMKDRGRWWTEGDQLCMKWFRWFDAKARCISLQRDGSKVYWQENSGETGTATITEAPVTAVASAAPVATRPVQQRAEQHRADARAPQPRVSEPRGETPVEVAAIEPRRPTVDIISRAPAPTEEAGSDARAPQEDSAFEPIPVAPSKPPVPRAAPAKTTQKAAPTQAPVAKTIAATKTAAASAAKAPRRPNSPAAISSSSMTLASFRVSRVVDGDMLNVRSGPSEYHDAVGAIPARGRGVQIVGECRDLWCPIRHGALKGWVNRYYLAEDVGQATSTGQYRASR